jgi:prepilin-type N-terminal cleavage/methylation domain-containing protein
MRNQKKVDSVERIAYSKSKNNFYSCLPAITSTSLSVLRRNVLSLSKDRYHFDFAQCPSPKCPEPVEGPLSAKKGFTLLELLLALGITVVVLVLSYSTFRVGWISYRRLDNQSLVYYNLRGGLYKMRKELSGAFLFDYRSSKEGKNYCLGFQGAKEELSFVTLINSRDSEGNIFVEVAKAFYKYENKKLLRAFVKGRDVLNTNSSPQYQVFLANLSALEFSYAAGKSSEASSVVWKSEFTGKDEKDNNILPGAVRIKVTQEFNGLPSIKLIKSIQLAG